MSGREMVPFPCHRRSIGSLYMYMLIQCKIIVLTWTVCQRTNTAAVTRERYHFPIIHISDWKSPLKLKNIEGLKLLDQRNNYWAFFLFQSQCVEVLQARAGNFIHDISKNFGQNLERFVPTSMQLKLLSNLLFLTPRGEFKVDLVRSWKTDIHDIYFEEIRISAALFCTYFKTS